MAIEGSLAPQSTGPRRNFRLIAQVNGGRANSRVLVLQMANQLRTIGSAKRGNWVSHLGFAHQRLQLVNKGMVRTLDSCPIAIYEVLRSWQSSRLFGAFNQI
jgi:hypothetical protein